MDIRHELYANTIKNGMIKAEQDALNKRRFVILADMIKGLIMFPLGLIFIPLLRFGLKKTLLLYVISFKAGISSLLIAPLMVTDLAKFAAINATFINDAYKVATGQDIQIQIDGKTIDYNEEKYEAWLNQAIK